MSRFLDIQVSLFDIGDFMSFKEKATWLYLAIAVVVPAAYFGWLLSEWSSTPAEEIAFVRPMIIAVIASIVLNIVLTIPIAAVKPSEVDKTDEREIAIERHGEQIGVVILGTGAALVMGLLWFDVDHVWSTNLLYLSFVTHAIVASTIKLIKFRKGL